MQIPETAPTFRDVTLRDGLQDERPIPTDTKMAIFAGLVVAGISQMEICSFVRPDRVPAQADADEFAWRTAGGPAERWALVLNGRGTDRAIAAGIDRLQFVLSISDTHNLRNAGRTIEDSLAELATVASAAASAGAIVEVTLATAFGCPYEGPVAPAAVLAVAERCLAAGVEAVSLADTIGTAIPNEVATLTRLVAGLSGPRPLGIHLHDTRGLGIVNALAAIESGATRVDGSVGGLGGCPFAPGASGNLPLEDIVHLFEASGVSTGIDLDALVAVGALACRAVGRDVSSHIGVAGPRFARRVLD